MARAALEKTLGDPKTYGLLWFLPLSCLGFLRFSEGFRRFHMRYIMGFLMRFLMVFLKGFLMRFLIGLHRGFYRGFLGRFLRGFLRGFLMQFPMSFLGVPEGCQKRRTEWVFSLLAYLILFIQKF